jgi:lysozyme
MTMHTRYLDSIKSFEGFTPQAKFDYAQHSNGFGTKALHPGEVIDRAEAERRFSDEIGRARQFVERHAAGWDEGTKAALTSLTFNAGTRWANSGLGEALRAGDLEAARNQFLKYTKAGGDDLPGLVRRRMAEATWFGNSGQTGGSAVADVRPDAGLAAAAQVVGAPLIGSAGSAGDLPGASSVRGASFPLVASKDTGAPMPGDRMQQDGQASAISTFALAMLKLDVGEMLALTERAKDDKSTADARRTA